MSIKQLLFEELQKMLTGDELSRAKSVKFSSKGKYKITRSYSKKSIQKMIEKLNTD